MARENQGLQIALIVFVMLTLILGVTTFVFYRQYDDANTKALAAEKEKTTVDQNLKKAQDDIARLKQILGFGATDTMEVVDQEVNRDRQVAGASLPEADRVYRKMVQHLNDTVQKKNQALAAAEKEKQDLQNKLAANEQAAAARIKELQDTVTKTGADLQQVTAAYADARTKLNAQKDELLGEKTSLEEKIKKDTGALQVLVAQRDKVITNAQSMNEKLRKDMDALVQETFETALGKVMWVNQRMGRVYINLGEADGLRRLTNFGVFSSDTDDVSRSKKKASIEVVEIIGPHMAEARITQDDPKNPIQLGDLVFTPIWAPGKRIRFALAGLMDLDGDGRSDLQRVRDLVTVNGAVIDAYQDATGKTDINSKIVGEITTDTNYLVIGEGADEKSSRQFRSNVTKMIDDAKANLVKQIKLSDLLERMGYREVDRVVRFGPGANPADFRPQPPEGGVPVSSGYVSPLYQPRNPPRGSRQ